MTLRHPYNHSQLAALIRKLHPIPRPVPVRVQVAPTPAPAPAMLAGRCCN